MKIFYPVNIFLTLVFCSVASLVANAQFAPTPCFKADTFTTGGGLALGTVTANFNSKTDTCPDVVTLNYTGLNITLLLGNCKGVLGPPASFPISGINSVSSISTGDYNKDGYADVAVSGYTYGTYIGMVLVFYGDGLGGFTTTSFSLGYQYYPVSGGITSADFDKDGYTDIAVSNTGNQTISLLLSTTKATGGHTFNVNAAAYSFPASLGQGYLSGLTSADYNGDGVVDIAAANNYTNGAVVILPGNNGDGFYFNSPITVTLPSTANPTSITTGDFNKDGWPDLGVIGSNPNVSNNDYYSLSVLLNSNNTTTPSFNAGAVILLTPEVYSISSGDFNQDGYTDLATANNNSYSVSVMLSAGGSNFGIPVNFSDPQAPTALAVADFNGDGKTDIAAAASNVELLLNNFIPFGVTLSGLSKTYCANAPNVTLTGSPGGGEYSGYYSYGNTFYQFEYDSIFTPNQLSVGEGNTTVAITYTYTNANGCKYSAYDTTAVIPIPLFGVIGGALASSYLISQPNDTILISPAGGLFSGAGMSDTVPGTYNQGYTEAAFSPAAAGAGLHEIYYKYTDKTTGCSNVDSFSVSVVGQATVSTAAQSSAQPLCFSLPATYSLSAGSGGEAYGSVYSVATADFNKDGKQDIVAAANYLSNDGPASPVVFLNQGKGAFGTGIQLYLEDESYNPYGVATADFNGDGLPDLATSNTGGDGQSSGTVSVFLTDTTGGAINFTDVYGYNNEEDYYGLGNAYAIVTGDFNGDALPDIATLGMQPEDGPAQPAVQVLFNTNNTGFDYGKSESGGESFFSSMRSPVAMAAGQFTGDGFLDLAVVDNGTNAVYILANDGTGNFSITTSFSFGQDLQSVTTADFNGDKIPDLAVADYGATGDGVVAPGAIYILIGLGNGNYKLSELAINVNPNTIINADFNEDGKVDLQTANNNGSVSVFIGDGTGLFAQAGNFSAGSTFVALASADFNGDNKPDFVTSDLNNYTSLIDVLLNDYNKVSVSGLKSSYCQSETAALLLGNPSGGTFSGPGVSKSTSTGDSTLFSPSTIVLSEGQDSVIVHVVYTYTNVGGCTYNDSTAITVRKAAKITIPTVVCSNTNPFVITATPTGGVFTGSGIGSSYTVSGAEAALFSPSVLGAGQHAISYSITNGCSFDTTITIGLAPNVVFAGVAPIYCNNAAPVKLLANPSGGKFSGPGVLGGIFTPSAVPGTGVDTIVYQLTKGGCTGYDTLFTQVYAADLVSFTGLSSSYCINNSSTATLVGYPAGGTFSVVPEPPSGTISGDGSIFTPSIAGLGQHNFIYSYTNPTTGCVTTSTQTTDVYNSSTVYFSGLDSVYCTNTKSVTLTGFPTGGTFSGNGVTGNTFSPYSVGAGVYTIVYSLTNSNGCGGSYSSTTQVNNAIAVTVSGLSSTLCTNSPNVLLTASSSGGTFSAPDAPDAIVEGTNGTTFSPSIAGVGKTTIYYTYTNSLGCSGIDTLTTQIYAPTSVSFSGLASSYCANANSVNLKPSPSGSHGYFSTIGGDTNAFTNSTFYPSRTGITLKGSNYYVIYTFTDANNCTSSYKDSTSIVGLPNTTISRIQKEYCILNPSTDTVVGHPRGGNFVPLIEGYTSLAKDSGTFTPTLANAQDSSESGTIAYTYTDLVTGCSNTDIDTISIYRIPVVSSIKPVCYSAAPLPLVPNAHPPLGTFTYTGAGITGNLFDPSKIKNGADTITYQYTALGGCKTSGSIVLQPYKPDVQLQAINQSTGQRATLADAYCSNVGNIIIAANLSPGAYSYTNSKAFPVVSDSTMIFIPSAAGTTNTFTYIYTDSNSCSDTVIQTITVKSSPAKPVISSADTISICQNLTLDLTATDTSSGVTYTWNTPQKTYTQQSVSIDSLQLTGTGTYSVTVTSSNNCASSDTVYVLVKPSPVITNFYTPVTTVCDFNAAPVVIAVQSDIHNYNWYYNGIKISGQHTNTLEIATVGEYKIAVINNTNNCITYDSVTISGNGQTPVISLTGAPLDSVLTSTPASSYQWYVNNKKIIGETNQTLQIAYNGNYSVLDTYSGGCKDFSEPYAVNRYNLISITRLTQTDSTINFPSSSAAATSNIIIKYDEVSKNYYVEYTPVQDEVMTITVTAMTGEVLWKKDVNAEKSILSSTPVNVNGLASAMYILNAATSEQSQYRKIIVE